MGRIVNIVLLGAPGSGKGTQADKLQAVLGLIHVASGDLFRENLKENTKLGLLAREYMNRGDLVPDSVTVEMLRRRLRRADAPKGIVLDGFPRTLAQAEALGQLLAELGQPLDGVLYIQVSDQEVVRRLSGRLICRECQTPFHQTFNPFEKCPENRCDGEFLYQREDDKPETVRTRLKTFGKQTKPLIDYYRRLGILFTVRGEGSVAEVTQALLQILHKLGATPHSVPE
ncbi:MAG: adenylate kinase [Acidobacteriota bacterium]